MHDQLTCCTSIIQGVFPMKQEFCYRKGICVAENIWHRFSLLSQSGILLFTAGIHAGLGEKVQICMLHGNLLKAHPAVWIFLTLSKIGISYLEFPTINLHYINQWKDKGSNVSYLLAYSSRRECMSWEILCWGDGDGLKIQNNPFRFKTNGELHWL